MILAYVLFFVAAIGVWLLIRDLPVWLRVVLAVSAFLVPSVLLTLRLTTIRDEPFPGANAISEPVH
jgi:hypothetical protein